MSALSTVVGKVAWFSLLGLAGLTPLLFSTSNTELFEVPKMLFVYLVSSILLTTTLLHCILEKKVQVSKNLPTTAFLIFILLNIVSTVFSVDKFTSFFGYPTRLNGGLLSLFSYFTIMVAAQTFLDKQKAMTLLKTVVVSSLLVALWGIPSHFGKDPTCWILTRQLTSQCWQEEFQPTLRIFSTLGQPNWLASYLVLIFPLSVTLLLKSKTNLQKAIFAAATLCLFLAFIFTNSRSGLAGISISLLVLILLLGRKTILKNIKIVAPAAVVLLIISLFFGSSLVTRLKETKTGVAPGGTETGRIRLIVWQGAISNFLQKPFLGSGPETFVYAYQKNRPQEHNLTTEWNFFYNKAHNEFLNYLSNLGILGTGAYLFFVGASLFSLFKSNDIFAKGIIGGIIGYHATILFGFSTVATQTLMFLLLAAGIGKNYKTYTLAFPRFFQVGLILITFVFGLWLTVGASRLYLSDVFFNRAKQSNSASRSTRGFTNAIAAYPTVNPFYLADFANNAAIFSKNFEDEQVARDYSDLSSDLSKTAYAGASGNFLALRKLINAYTLISAGNQKYLAEAEIVVKRLLELAPTDPQSYLSVAKYYAAVSDHAKSKQNLEVALKLKPDYVEAQELETQIDQLENLTNKSN